MTAGLSMMALASAWLRSGREEARAVRLAPDATVRLAPRGRPLTVSARGGTVVVTQEGDHSDHVLTAGDAVRLAARGVVVVWALDDAAVTVERSAA